MKCSADFHIGKSKSLSEEDVLRAVKRWVLWGYTILDNGLEGREKHMFDKRNKARKWVDRALDPEVFTIAKQKSSDEGVPFRDDDFRGL